MVLFVMVMVVTEIANATAAATAALAAVAIHRRIPPHQATARTRLTLSLFWCVSSATSPVKRLCLLPGVAYVGTEKLGTIVFVVTLSATI